jgi:hypothetical protein
MKGLFFPATLVSTPDLNERLFDAGFETCLPVSDRRFLPRDRATVRTYGELLESCHRERGESAAETERINSEKKLLINAWPQGTTVHRIIHPQAGELTYTIDANNSAVCSSSADAACH